MGIRTKRKQRTFIDEHERDRWAQEQAVTRWRRGFLSRDWVEAVPTRVEPQPEVEPQRGRVRRADEWDEFNEAWITEQTCPGVCTPHRGAQLTGGNGGHNYEPPPEAGRVDSWFKRITGVEL